MLHSIRRHLLPASAALLLTITPLAHAQLLDTVKGALGGQQQSGASSAGSLLGGTSGQMPSLSSVGTGNLTGVIEYCAKNNYLGGGASGVKDKLMEKLGGTQQAKKDPGYQEGLSGVLGGNSGQKMDLSGDGLKKQVTEKVCDQVLQYGKSLL